VYQGSQSSRQPSKTSHPIVFLSFPPLSLSIHSSSSAATPASLIIRPHEETSFVEKAHFMWRVGKEEIDKRREVLLG
jgi:hypothetical protein